MIKEVWVLHEKMVAHNLRSDKGSDGEYFVQVSRDTLDQKPALNARRARSSAPTETEVSLQRAISRQAAGISMGPSSIQRRNVDGFMVPPVLAHSNQELQLYVISPEKCQ